MFQLDNVAVYQVYNAAPVWEMGGLFDPAAGEELGREALALSDVPLAGLSADWAAGPEVGKFKRLERGELADSARAIGEAERVLRGSAAGVRQALEAGRPAAELDELERAEAEAAARLPVCRRREGVVLDLMAEARRSAEVCHRQRQDAERARLLAEREPELEAAYRRLQDATREPLREFLVLREVVRRLKDDSLAQRIRNKAEREVFPPAAGAAGPGMSPAPPARTGPARERLNAPARPRAGAAAEDVADAGEVFMRVRV
jgi:hypothetical protein